MDEVNSEMSKNGQVEIKNVLHFGSLNNVMMSVFGKSYDFFGGKKNDEAENLEGLVKEGYELLGIFNWGDHFAPLRWLDLQGVRRRCKSLVEKVNVYVGNIIEEHRTLRREKVVGDEDSHDFVDVLLDLEDGENKLSDSDMIALLWVSFYLCFLHFHAKFVGSYHNCCFWFHSANGKQLNMSQFSFCWLFCFVELWGPSISSYNFIYYQNQIT